MSITDNGCATLTIRSIHCTGESTVAKYRTLMADGKETAVCSIARIATCDVDCHYYILISAVATAHEAQTTDKALCALNASINNKIADG